MALAAAVPERAPPDIDRLRATWRRMVGEVLPAAARGRPDWPVRLDHCFARVILDAVCGQPWREVIAAPAWRNMTVAELDAALACADALLRGEADLAELNARSLRLRGKTGPRHA